MSEAEWVTTYTSDETGPNVDDFDLDFDEGLLTLSFDEIVDTATLVPEEVTLLHSGGSFLKLSDVSSLDTEPLRYARIQIGNDDLNTLKRNYICTLRDECFLSISSSLIRDTSHQTNVAIASGSPLPVSLYTNDSTYPSVVRFTEFDLDQGSFVLEFSKTVSSSSVNTDVLEFHNKYVNASHVFTPTESVEVSSDSHILNFMLETSDINFLKLNTELCTDAYNCWLHLSSDFISDINGNEVVPILSGTMDTFHETDIFLPDITSPLLESYTVDLDIGYLTFTFNEVVREDTFNPRNLNFQDSFVANVSVSIYDLGNFNHSSNGLTINWYMSTPDLNLIKASETIFTNENNSYLTNSVIIEDVSGVTNAP